MRILVTSDDHDTLARATEYTLLFAGDASITLMDRARQAQEMSTTSEGLQRLADRVRSRTSGSVEVVMGEGNIVKRVLELTSAQSYDLIVFGIHLHRRLDRLRPKLTARELAARLRRPLLVVFPAWERLHRILVWSAGEEPDEFALRLVGRMAAEIDAEVTVLHVMSQIPLTADADLEDLERSAEDLIEHETHEGRLLQGALDLLQERGVPPANCEVKVRHGLTIDEIIDESEEGDYDLVAIGAVGVPSQKPWNELQGLVQEDLATRVLMEASRPVLVARGAPGGVDWTDL